MYTFRIQDEHTAEFVFAVFVISFQVLGKVSIKKNVFFRAMPESPNPPPDPNSGNLVLFFGRQISRFKSQFRTKNTIYSI